MMKCLFRLKNLSSCLALFLAACSELNTQRIQHNQLDVDVIKVEQREDLRLFLNNAQKQPYQSFKAVAAGLKTCEQMQFAMNAGMYHPDFSPVGLYIEQGVQFKALNLATGFGNFFLQPNGVLAWNAQHAVIQTTAQYQTSQLSTDFKPQFATQSGPMLVIDGKINPTFLAQSNSLKIRNGVGIKNNTLYFVISRNRVSFYDFAQVFQQQLAIENALYLDGSISSLYAPELNRHDQNDRLGPIIALVDGGACS